MCDKMRGDIRLLVGCLLVADVAVNGAHVVQLVLLNDSGSHDLLFRATFR
jgi:hypothetical protein